MFGRKKQKKQKVNFKINGQKKLNKKQASKILKAELSDQIDDKTILNKISDVKQIKDQLTDQLKDNRSSQFPGFSDYNVSQEPISKIKNSQSQLSSQISNEIRLKNQSMNRGVSTRMSSGYTVSELNSDADFFDNSNQSGAKNTFIFTLGEMISVQKPVKNYVYYVKLCFLSFQSFNLVYLSVLLYSIFNFIGNSDFRLILFEEFGLALLTIVITLRLIKSLYGVHAVLFARSRRPLYLFLLFNYFVSCLYILIGLFVLFTPYIRNRFERAMTRHLKELTFHYYNEKPTWYLIENVQHYGQCCGYQSVIDYLRIYADEYQSKDLFKPDYYLPLTCCKNAIRGDICLIYKDDIIYKGCAEFLQIETMKRINLPIMVLLTFDLLSLIFIVYLMRRFKDNLIRVEIKEDEIIFLGREQMRLIKELLANRFIRERDIEKVKEKYQKTIQLEKSLNLRPTMEGLVLIIKRDGIKIEIRSLNPGIFRFEPIDYDYLEDQFKTGFNDLFKRKEKPIKKELDHELMPTKIKTENTLLMAGGEKLSTTNAEKNLAEFGLEKKIQPWQAVRTRNAFLQINKTQEKLKNLHKIGLKTMIRFDSLETRLDKHTIEQDLKELKAKGEAISNEVKNKIATAKMDDYEAQKMNVRIIRQEQTEVSTKDIRKGKKKPVKTTSDIIDDKEIDSDEIWNDVRNDK